MIHVECKTCGATLTMDDHHRSAVCPFCASPTVVERPPSADVIPPTFALGFAVPRERAIEAVRAWAKRGFFRPASFHTAAIEDLRGIYVPAWLYSAITDVQYSASIGENYTVTHTRTVMRDGKMVTETYTTTETEWRDLAGRFLGYVSDVLVTASTGLGNQELGALEPFDLRTLTRYSPAMISGWLAEDVTLAAQASRNLAHQEATALVSTQLTALMPGDRHSDLRFVPSFASETADVVLVPVWVLAMRHAQDAPPTRVLVNGQSGKIVGKKPISWWKVAGVTLIVLAVIFFLFLVVVVGTQL